MKESLSYELLTMISQGADLQKLIDYASSLYKNKMVTLISTSSRLIACSSEEQVSNLQIREQIKQGFLSEATYTLCRDDRLFARLHTDKHAFICEDPQHEELAWLMGPVRSQNVTVAYFVVLGDDRSFSADDLDSADVFCKVLAILLTNEAILSQRMPKAEAVFINDLLRGMQLDESAAISKMRMLGLPVCQELCVVVFQSKKRTAGDSDFTLRAFSDAITDDYFPQAIFTIFDRKLVFLVNRDEWLAVGAEAELEPLRQLLASSELILGCSNPFQRITQIRTYYEQAVEAIELGQKYDESNSVFLYSDYSVYQLIQTSPLNPRELCHPKLYSICRSGSTQEREELKSFFLYFRYMKNAGKVAEMLHIHKNTLFYRVNKMVEATGLDINRGDDVLQIMISDRVIQALEIERYL